MVDDQANIRKFLCRRLAMEGIQTETAVNGLEVRVREALTKLAHVCSI